MRRRFVRWLAASFLVILGAACPAIGFAVVSQAQPQPNAESAQNAQGIDTRDREFIRLIRFANLWEMPMGDLAAKEGSTQRVRDVGATIAADHRKLDVAVKDIAARFGVPLPDQATSSQEKWMGEIRASSGQQFDRTFADRLRAAHGTVFSTVAEERAGTRNAAMRDFATTANTIVMKHMTLLESTGDVDAQHGMFAEAGARSYDTPENHLSGGQLALGAVVAALIMAATIGVVRTFSSPGTAK
jgi:predicted outer membrane protein